MKYTISYKKPNGIFWKKVKNITGDTILAHEGHVLPVRVFFLENKKRLEIPMSYAVCFSKERFYDIKDQMEQAAKQTIPIKGGKSS